jgi:hypothetical protein
MDKQATIRTIRASYKIDQVEDPLEMEIRKLVKSYNLVAEDVDKHFVTGRVRS